MMSRVDAYLRKWERRNAPKPVRTAPTPKRKRYDHSWKLESGWYQRHGVSE